MKYKIYENLLTEYTGTFPIHEIGEIEAESIEEALKLVKLQYPDKDEIWVADEK